MSEPYDTQPTGYDPPEYQAEPADGEGPTPATTRPDAARPAAQPPHTIQSTTIRCTTCGYNLTGVAIGSTCPECGSKVDPSLLASQAPTSGKAIAAMVLGICSIPAACMSYGILGLPCAVIGLILWHLAKKELAGSTGSAAGMNTAGLVTSIIGLSFSVIGVGLIAFFILMGIFA